MIDNPGQVERLVAKLRESLPLFDQCHGYAPRLTAA
jgi:hypothetical protein